MTDIRNSIISGIAFGLISVLMLMMWLPTTLALIGGLFAGLAFGVVIYLFISSKAVNRQTQPTIDGEAIIHSGRANHFMSREAVGGKLHLYRDKLIFKSHSFNIQSHELIIEPRSIQKVALYNTLGLIPNGLKIVMTDGTTEKFVINKRKYWQEAIEKLRDHS